MGAIDWNILQPTRGPGQEIASITNLLSSIAEKRARAQQEEYDRAIRERQLAMQEQNTQLDNQRADEQLQLTRNAQAAQAEQHAAAAEEAKRKAGYAALPGIKAALGKGNEEGARLAAEEAGVSYAKDTEPRPQDIAAQQARGQATHDNGVGSLDAFAGVGMLPGPVPMMAARMPVTPDAPTAAERAPRYRLGLPGRPVLDYSPYEEEQALQANRGKQADELGSALGPAMRSPYARQAISEVQGMVKSGQFKPEDAAKATLERIQHLEDQANSTIRTGMGIRENAARGGKIDERAAAAEAHKVTSENQRSVRELKGEISQWASVNDMKGLGKLYGEAQKASELGASRIGLTQVGALDQFVKGVRGAAAVGNAVNLAADHLGGIVDSIKGKISQGDTGEYAESQRANLNGAIKELKAALKTEALMKHEGFVGQFYGDTYGDMKSNVDDAYDGMFKQFGLKAKRTKGTRGVSIGGSSFTTARGDEENLHDEADRLLGGAR